MRRRSIGVILFSIFFITLEGFLALFPPKPITPLFIHNTFHFACIVIGLGLFLIKEWARRLVMILYPIFSLFELTYGWQSRLQKITQQYPDVSAEVIKAMHTVMSIFGYSLFPVLVIYFFTRPKVKEQFKTS